MPSVVRASMADLIARVRVLIGDPSGAAAAFTDDQIQDRLDMGGRVDVQFVELTPRFTLSNGRYVYTDYYAPGTLGGDWETNETLFGLNFTQLTPTTSDRIVGHWTFTGGSYPNGQYPPVIIYGQCYDTYRTAADLLEMRAASLVSTKFDFSADGRNMRLSQIPANYMALAKQYRLQSKPRMLKLVRSDVNASAYAARVAEYGPVSAGVPFLTGP